MKRYQFITDPRRWMFQWDHGLLMSMWHNGEYRTWFYLDYPRICMTIAVVAALLSVMSLIK